jgi:hypothetical protein
MTETWSLTLDPQWSEIERAREQGRVFLERHGIQGDAMDAVTMVIGELVENAIKHGHFPTGSERGHVSVTVGPEEVVVETRNPVDPADRDRLEHLDAMLQKVRGYHDPFQAYLARLKEVSTESLESRQSGMGVVRIAYEGQSLLDFFVDEDNVLAVSAVYRRCA